MQQRELFKIITFSTLYSPILPPLSEQREDVLQNVLPSSHGDPLHLLQCI